MADTIAIIAALVVAALVLFALEIVTPTFGVLAGLGIATLGGALWMAFSQSTTAGFLLLFALMVIVPVYLSVLIKFLPKSPFGRRLFLADVDDSTGAGTPEAPAFKSLVGKTGRTETPLRPTGAIRIDSRRVIGSAESGMIAQGADVKVVRAVGTNVIVRPIRAADRDTETENRPAAEAGPEQHERKGTLSENT